MSAAPDTIPLDTRDLADLTGFAGEVTTSDWLLPGLCHKASGGNLIQVAADDGEGVIEDIESPKHTWPGDDAAPGGCGAGSTSANVFRLPEPSEADDPSDVARVSTAVKIERADRGRFVRAVVGGVEGKKNGDAVFAVLADFSSGFSWDHTLNASERGLVDAFVPAGESLTLMVGMEGRPADVGGAGVFIAGVSVTEFGEAEQAEEEATEESASADPEGEELPTEADDPDGDGDGASVTAKPRTTPEPETLTASAWAGASPAAGEIAAGPRGLRDAPCTPDPSPSHHPSFSAKKASTASMSASWHTAPVEVEKVGYLNVDFSTCNTTPTPSALARPNSFGVLPANLQDCLGTPIPPGSVVEPTDRITWVYWMRDTTSFNPSYFAVTISVVDSKLGPVCSGVSSSTGEGDENGFFCVASESRWAP